MVSRSGDHDTTSVDSGDESRRLSAKHERDSDFVVVAIGRLRPNSDEPCGSFVLASCSAGSVQMGNYREANASRSPSVRCRSLTIWLLGRWHLRDCGCQAWRRSSNGTPAARLVVFHGCVLLVSVCL